MSLSQGLLPEFDQEMALARKTLERVPEGRNDWKPHEKSMTLGRLASHIAEIPGWGSVTIEQDQFDMAPPGAPPYQPPVFETREALLAEFDKGVAAARRAIAAAGDDGWMQPWSLLNGGQTLFSMPRIAVLRGMIMNHLIHHRAQLGVYLRMNDVPVPATYGPSADEPSF